MSLTGKWYGFGRNDDFDAGLRAFDAGDFAMATESFRRVTRFEFDTGLKIQARTLLVTALSKLGRNLFEEGQAIESREVFREAIGIAPTYPDLWLGLAMAAGRLEDDATETGALQRARTLNPGYARAILYEALIHLKQGDLPRAKDVLSKLPTGHPSPSSNDRLIDVVQAILDSEGDDASDLVEQAGQAAKGCEFDIAADLLRRAAQLRPSYADIRCQLAQMLLELDDVKEAESHLRAALEINPKYVEAWAQLGIALKRQKRISEAKEAFVRAHELDPEHPIAKMEIRRSP